MCRQKNTVTLGTFRYQFLTLLYLLNRKNLIYVNFESYNLQNDKNRKYEVKLIFVPKYLFLKNGDVFNLKNNYKYLIKCL